MTDTGLMMRVHTERGPLVAEQVELSAPPRGWVRIRIAASGVCNADLNTVKAHEASTPVTPGHEIAGVVDALGEGVEGWSLGENVAVGWFGGSCGHCEFCRSGDVVHCAQRKIPGLSYPGGWAESVIVPADALARIPEGLDPFDAAPMGCAGVTTFNAVRVADVPAGGRVAVFGIGGLGHLAVQFAARMGYEVVAISRGTEREELARSMGAQHYINSADRAPGAALQKLGGVDLIISTAATTKPVSELIEGLRVGGKLMLLGVDDGVVEVPVAQVVMKSLTVTGHLTGSPRDIEETMQFALLNNVRPLIERMPIEQAERAVAELAAGTPRFRIVLDATAGR